MDLGATVLHGVDATKMKHHIELSKGKFDRIVYDFPHAGFYGKEDNPLMIQMHADLVCGFFSNERWLLQHNGEIHVSHKNSAPYCDWNLKELAHENHLHLIECVPFDIEDYPYYQNKRGQGLASDVPFNLGDCSTFKFIALLNDYSNYMILRDGMCPDTIPSKHNSFSRDPFVPKKTEPLPQLKFVVRGLVRLYPLAAGYAGVLMDSENSVVAYIYGPLLHFNSDVAELLAIKHALMAIGRSKLCGKVPIIVESDSRNAVSWIKSDFGNPLEVQATVKEIKMSISWIGNVDIRCSFGEHGVKTGQHMVEELAKRGYDMVSNELWF